MLLGIIALWLAVLGHNAAFAQTNNQCTVSPGIPWDEQIVGCTGAIESGRYGGNNLATAFNNRGIAYLAKGDFDIAHFDQAIRLNPNYALAFNNRGFSYALKQDHDHATADYTEATGSIPATSKRSSIEAPCTSPRRTPTAPSPTFPKRSGSLPATARPTTSAVGNITSGAT